MKNAFSSKYPTILLLIATTLICGTQRVMGRKPEPDHTIWIHLETEPNGATIYALPQDEMAEPTIKIGTTPCVIAVDLMWNRGLFGKNWNRMTVWSPGNICRAIRQPDKNYDIVLSFLAVKGGYTDKRVQQRALILKHPGKGWRGKSRWPKKTTIRIPLDRQRRSLARNTAKKQRARRVILADGEEATGDSSSGTLKVRANVPGAEIYVDKKYIGDVPIQVILNDGQHIVEVRKKGFYPVRKAIYVNDDAEVTYDARLLPLTP